MPTDLLSQLVSTAIRAAGLGLVAFAALLLFRIRSSAARHAAWTAVLAGMLLQIPLGMVAPEVPLQTPPILLAPLRPLSQPRVTESARISVPASHARTETIAKRTSWGGVSLRGALTGVYLAISMLLFARLAVGAFGLRRVVRDTRPIPSLGPGIFESVLFAAPGSAGCFGARILLPQAWRDWDAAKLRDVLAHEGAHIRRQDWLIRVASRINVCIFWFHPLAWWMEHELTRLAEEACDDAALLEVGDREGYAATLVDIAREAAADRRVRNSGVISMANDSNVIARVNRILNRRLSAPEPFGRLAWVTLLACSLPAIYLSAAVKLAPANPDSTRLERAAVPARPAEPAHQPLVPEYKPSVRLIAQLAPNQSPRPEIPRPGDLPITMCILIDNSGSMRGKRAGVQTAALALMKASKPNDEVCIVDFNDEAYLDLDFTSNIAEMEGALAHFDSRGGKAMRDAVQQAIDHVQEAAHNGRKVLVLVTEGNDSASTVTQEQLLAKLRNSGVRVYCIGLVGEDDPRRASAARLALKQLSEASGGRDYYPGDLAEVESISPEVANEIRKP
jgi:uncharacterized protein YegL